MPDTILPYLNREQIASDIIPTSFGKFAVKKTESDEHLILSIDSAVVMEIVRLPYMNDETTTGSNDKDSVYCVLHTISLPERDTEVTIRDAEWNIISEQDFHGYSFTNKPDTLSKEEYDKIVASFDIKTVEAVYVGNKELKLKAYIPILFKDDEDRIKSLLIQRNVKWTNKIFK